MSDILLLDVAGQLPANLIEEDVVIGAEGRVFPLKRGSFFSSSVVITNLLTNTTLTKETDYKLVEIDVDAQRMSPGNEICRYVYIPKTNITNVRIRYRAIGGVFQFNGNDLSERIREYLEGTGAQKIVGLPDQYNPTRHTQNINDFFKLGKLDTAIERIENAVRAGRSDSTMESLLSFIEALGNEVNRQSQTQITDLQEQLTYLKARNDFRNGRYYLTGSDVNPASDKGGTWQQDQNILLYGAQSAADVGQLENVGIQNDDYIASLRKFWRRDDNGTIVNYNLSASANIVNEGDIVYFNLSVDGLPPGSIIPYRISGVDASDVGTPLTGAMVLSPTGTAQVTVHVVADRKTEGSEVMRFTLTNAPTNYVNVTVNDTSLSPVYQLFFSNDLAGNNQTSSVSEGGQFYIQLRGTNVQQGERIYLLTDGSTTNSSDWVTGTMPTYLDYDADGRASALVQVRADLTTEGNELLVLNGCTTNSIATKVITNTLTVLDTSRSSVYRSRFVSNADGTGTALTQISEGSVIYLIVDGDDLVEGTILNLNYTGQANASDFVGTRPITATIVNGKAIVQYSIRADLVTEGNEVFGVEIRSGSNVVTSATITILDTSINQSFDLYFSSTSTGADRIDSSIEGQTVYLTIRTVGVPNGTRYPLTYEGLSAVDFNPSPPTELVVNNNMGYVQIGIAADQLTEGTEILTVRLGGGTNVSTSLTIWDTSITAVISTRWSNRADGGDTITTTPEGRTIYLTGTTQGIQVGDTVNVAWDGTANASDFLDPLPTTATIDLINGSDGFSIPIRVKADGLVEGSESLGVVVSYLGVNNRAPTLTILDTSYPPNLTVRIVSGITSAVTGDTWAYQIEDLNKQLAPDAMVYINYSNLYPGATLPILQSNYFINTPPIQIQLNNWVATIDVRLRDMLPPTTDTIFPFNVGTSREIADTTTGPGTDGFGNSISITVRKPVLTSYFALSPTGDALDVDAEIPANSALYYVVKCSVAKNGSSWAINPRLDNKPATVANGYVTQDVAINLTMTNGAGYVRYHLTELGFPGNRYLWAECYDSVVTNGQYTSREGWVNRAETRVSLTTSISEYVTYFGRTYARLSGFNTWDYFVSVKGRVPSPNEIITFVNSGNNAIMSNWTNVPALHWDSRWDQLAFDYQVKLENSGMIVGMGGDGGGSYSNSFVSQPKPGANGLQNDSVNIQVWVVNSGVIAGGGGGGGSAGDSGSPGIISGGAGAPYGPYHTNGPLFQPNDQPTQATFAINGNGGRINIFNNVWWYGGNGGVIGSPGTAGNAGGHTAPAPAGFFKIGRINLVNISDGVTLGRDG